MSGLLKPGVIHELHLRQVHAVVVGLEDLLELGGGLSLQHQGVGGGPDGSAKDGADNKIYGPLAKHSHYWQVCLDNVLVEHFTFDCKAIHNLCWGSH